MIHRSPIHKSEADKLAQIYRDKQFVHEGTVYELDIVQSKESTRLARMRPKDAVQKLVGTAAIHRVEVNSDTCMTVAQHYHLENAKAMYVESLVEKSPVDWPELRKRFADAPSIAETQAKIESMPPASIESDDDIPPAPKKAVKAKAPAKPKPAVKKLAVKKKKK